MESNLQNVARIMAGFNFSFEDYKVDGGKNVVRQAIIHFENNGGTLNEESLHAIRRYIDCCYEQVKIDAVQWHHSPPVLFTGDEISFCFRGTPVSGIVFISPKRIGLTMKEPYEGLHDDVVIQTSMPIIFTQDLADGSPANSDGVARAQEMLERLFFCHAGI
ncbi:MAG: hypothetical protein IKU04_05675 [Bacteroidales bacterium]|nr:hypothetical protein [Bacteroidales bacterium]